MKMEGSELVPQASHNARPVERTVRLQDEHSKANVERLDTEAVRDRVHISQRAVLLAKNSAAAEEAAAAEQGHNPALLQELGKKEQLRSDLKPQEEAKASAEQARDKTARVVLELPGAKAEGENAKGGPQDGRAEGGKSERDPQEREKISFEADPGIVGSGGTEVKSVFEREKRSFGANPRLIGSADEDEGAKKLDLLGSKTDDETAPVWGAKEKEPLPLFASKDDAKIKPIWQKEESKIVTLPITGSGGRDLDDSGVDVSEIPLFGAGAERTVALGDKLPGDVPLPDKLKPAEPLNIGASKPELNAGSLG